MKNFSHQPNDYTTCYECKQTINDKYLLKALDKYWHEDCLKCACCDCRLGEIGCKLYTKANLILCKKDYLRYLNGNYSWYEKWNNFHVLFEDFLVILGIVYHVTSWYRHMNWSLKLVKARFIWNAFNAHIVTKSEQQI